MDVNEDYTSQFKNTIEKIVNAEIDKRGITKYVSAIVKDVNEDGTINVYIPPNLNSVINGLLNKTGETLSAGDSVELCTKNGYINNAWVSIKHKTNNSGTQGGGIPTGGTTGQILTKKSDTDYDTEWRDGIDTGNNLLFYQPGDTFECDYDVIMSGYITSGATGVRVSFPSPKRLDNITSITCQSFKCEARGIKGYLNGEAGSIEYVGRSGYTIRINKSNNNVINFLIIKSSAWTNVDNNTPVAFVAYKGDLKLTFN